jgi:hypothetical protein
MTEWYREDLAYIHDVGHAAVTPISLSSPPPAYWRSWIKAGYGRAW